MDWALQFVNFNTNELSDRLYSFIFIHNPSIHGPFSYRSTSAYLDAPEELWASIFAEDTWLETPEANAIIYRNTKPSDPNEPLDCPF